MRLLFNVFVLTVLIPTLSGLAEKKEHSETAWTHLKPNSYNVKTNASLIREGWKPKTFVVIEDSVILIWEKK